MTNRTETLVACVVMIDNEGRRLLVCRPEGEVNAGWWEVHGGQFAAVAALGEAARRAMRDGVGMH